MMFESGRPRSRLGRVVPVLIALGAAAVLGACSGGATPGGDGAGSHGAPGGAGSGATSPGAPGAAGTLPAEQAAQQIMGSQEETDSAGLGAGTLDAASGPVKVGAEAVSVQTDAQETRVTWRLKNLAHGTVDTGSFQLARPPLMDTRALGLADAGGGRVYHPYTYVPVNSIGGEDTACVCSELPERTNDSGQLLYAELPPLPESVHTVTLTLPGFASVKNVPVHR
ncbi:hypothetical protein [Brevibacterium moorei]|uniref:hypothetical protein n=2 Tax=Brevibacterium TaxID=1696 RepID=UPI00211C4CE1|nr:hypothetical protein [Brevibacterium sp. 68QC2CO]MCQ9385558.1 hypothetical protein [Brevibacterium sp. 68QC2CO]